MTLSIKGLCVTLSISDTQHSNALSLRRVYFIHNYAECHYAECRFAECRGALVVPSIIRLA
jgi:hypothetical protein